MADKTSNPTTELSRAGIVHLLTRARFEVLPIEGIQDEIRRQLAVGTTVHIVCPAALGADVSVRFATEIARAGFDAIPHVAARTVRDMNHLRSLLERMSDVGIVRAFFPGGDGKVPAGKYTSAVELVRDLSDIEHALVDIGVTCYPQSHPTIPNDVLMQALLEKQSVATFMVSESCLDPGLTLAWLRRVRNEGVTLPLMVGVPGIVPIRRLLAAYKAFGLREARTFLQKQHGMVNALLRRRFSPKDVVFGLAEAATDPLLAVDRIHFFTFNAIAGTETWRQRTLQQSIDTLP
jgi:methylenetetrahydrofolate reductase (NADPH)